MRAVVRVSRCLFVVACLCAASQSGLVAQQAPQRHEYRVLATERTSTMQKELNEAGAAGYRFTAVMGGETAFGGKEVVVVMERGESGATYEYRLLATNRTSTMQKELQEAADAGYDYRGQTVFNSMFGGDEVTCILERVAGAEPRGRVEFKLLATARTSTMQKELQAAGEQGFEVLGLTVGKTALGGKELVTIMRRRQ